MGSRRQASAGQKLDGGRAAVATTSSFLSSISSSTLLYSVGTMSFAALRASARRVNVVASSARGSRAALRNPAFRKYSTEVPPNTPAPKSSNTLLIGGIAAAAIGGAAFWVYTSNSSSAKEAGTSIRSGVQAAKAAANYVPTKEDYQKVRRQTCC